MKTEKILEKSNIENIISLTPIQEGMLFYYLNGQDSQMYFEQLSFRVEGELNFDKFVTAWKVVTNKYPMLRTVFRWKKLENPVQIVLKQHNIPIFTHDLTHLPADVWPAQLEQIWTEDRQTGIDIEEAPMRILLTKLSSDCFEMTLSSYHIILDGWSNGIILQDFMSAYCSVAQRQDPSLGVSGGYDTFVQWLEGIDVEKQKQYWADYLEGLEEKTPLKYDFDKPDTLQNSVSYNKIAPAGLLKKIQDFCVGNHITPATFYEFAWGLLLQKYTDMDDVLFGVTVSGRNPDLPGVENLVGLFINTVPVRMKIDQDTVVIDKLKELMQKNKEKTEYENTSLSEIRKVCRLDLDNLENMFDSIIVVENYPLDSFLTKAAQKSLDIKLNHIYEMTNYDLTIVVSEAQTMSLHVLYNPGRFQLNTIHDIVDRYYYIMEQILAGKNNVRDIFLLNEDERNKVLFDFNQTDYSFNKDQPLHVYVERQAEKTPDTVAVEFIDEKVTYKELNEKANRLASYLRKRNLDSAAQIAVAMDRSIDMVVALLAILKAGAAYLPLDINWPEDRILQILEDANVRHIIIDNRFKESISFSKLQGFEVLVHADIHVTKRRSPIAQFNDLPVPDRSHINICRYKNKIGMASVNNCISIQTTRGCPYECLYCHKIWSKKHVYRTAENIFEEIRYYYEHGVRNFAVIDDCFNLNMENSGRLFQLIIKNNLKLQLFFPNGLRGDIMTEDYIDLMVEAGTCGINLSLETASPRLQKILKKNLNLEKFYNVVQYIVNKHPHVLLEMATMHGFPTETEEEAMQTLNFIKSIHWLSFPYIHILKIFPNTEMEAFALENGVSKEKIMLSRNRAFHELPETLPFPKSFTRQYQANFMNDYFLNKDRLAQVLPVQMQVLEADALVQKYNAYLPVEIKTIDELLRFVQLEHLDIPAKTRGEASDLPTLFDTPKAVITTPPGAMKVLFLDLSQQFSGKNMIYNVTEQPLGHMYLLTYLKKVYGDAIDGRIYKSGVDFDSLEELRLIIQEYQPHLIGIRTLTIFKEFFHEAASCIRQWYEHVPLITGGPYASSDYDTILQDGNVDLVLFGEGEYTLSELIRHMLDNEFKLPGTDVLAAIEGIAYVKAHSGRPARDILVLDHLDGVLQNECSENLSLPVSDHDLAYVMYTSGTSGKPKGVMVEHRQVNNCIWWMQKEFELQTSQVVIQRTNLTFDPSVWEIFWPLYVGATVCLIRYEQSRNAEFLIELMREGSDATVLYCPASMLAGMLYVLENAKDIRLSMPRFLIGAESVSAKVIERFYSYFDGKIVNTYGPTECTINNTFAYIERDQIGAVIPIGKPIANNRIYILSRSLQPMPIGVPGEIYIAGDSVARGYINENALTQEKFIQSPFSSETLYKTGDLGKWNEFGEVEILGRSDEQIKVRGYRIEPAEIKYGLMSNPFIKDCAVVASHDRKDDIVRTCKICGITSKYPNVSVDENDECNICKNVEKYILHAEAYFKTIDDLEMLIKEQNRDGQSPYDCLLIYSCERVATYALYKLKEMGFRILTATYDPGHLTTESIDNIKNITNKIGVDHIFLRHKNSDKILRESLRSTKTMCTGCIHTSSALAGEYAYKHNIKVVIRETLSRGQIIDTKLYKFFQQGITDVEDISRSLDEIQMNASEIDKNIFEYIDINEIRDKSMYNKVKFIDFYRYCDVTNEKMIEFLNNKESFWKQMISNAIYSTDCYICHVGDYNFYHENGYHYNGGAKSWEKRLGHITLDELRKDLTLSITEKEHKSFLKKINYEIDDILDLTGTTKIYAYVTLTELVDTQLIKEELKSKLPIYMIPQKIIVVDQIPLTTNGKVDIKRLLEYNTKDSVAKGYIAPKNNTEKALLEIWRKILGKSEINVHENFFDIGGNSILLIKMHSQIEKLYPGRITITDLFGYSTISKLSERIDAGQEEETAQSELPEVILPNFCMPDPGEPVPGLVLQTSLDPDIVLGLRTIAKTGNVACSDILAAIFGYQLYEETENAQIVIQVSAKDPDTAVSVSLDFNQFENFMDMFHYVHTLCQKQDGGYSIKTVSAQKRERSQNGMIPLICTSGGRSLSEQSIQCFDFILEAEINDGQQIDLSVIYNAQTLKADKVKEFFRDYVQSLATLVQAEIAQD